MTLSLDAPIEDLMLSNRVRNVLRRRGFDTLSSLLRYDYKSALRGFGPSARAELISALESSGFPPPTNLSSPQFTDVAHNVSKLRGRKEAIFQKWHAQVERFANPPCHESRDLFAEQACDGANEPLIDEFRTRLTVIRTAAAGLSLARMVGAKRHEMVDLIEEECVRLDLLVNHLSDRWPPEESGPHLAGGIKDFQRKARERASDDQIGLSAEHELEPSAMFVDTFEDETWRSQLDTRTAGPHLHG